MTGSPILLAAGGTGGHLFPAFAVAEELARRGYDIDLITDMRGDRYGMGFPAREVYQVPAATLAGRTPGAVATTGTTLLKGLRGALDVLSQVKPAMVAGFGGYPTLAPVFAAKLKRRPILIQEQNAVMGRANRLLAPLAGAVSLAFADTKGVPKRAQRKTQVTGIPVRDAVLECRDRPYWPLRSDGPLALLIFGGSQGARFFSDIVPPALTGLPEAVRQRLVVMQQAREEDVERVRAAYEEFGITAEVASFFADLPERMAHAHLVIARAGASTVAELTAIGRPAILVPLPHALDNDQLENATRVQEAGGAWCIAQAELSPDRLMAEISAFCETPQRLVDAAQAARDLGKPDAVDHLADLIEALARRGLR